MQSVAIIHYHEIALKGGNRDLFERQLIENIRWALRDVAGVKVQRMSGRIAVRYSGASTPSHSPSLSEGEKKVVSPLPIGRGGEGGWGDITERLSRVFGIANIQVGDEVRQERKKLVEDVVSILQAKVPGTLAGKVPGTFAVRVKRGNKTYPATSQELEREIGAAIVETTGLGVDLEHPDLTVAVEIVEDTAFVLLEKITGPGGLPTGSAGRVVVLVSSGFDSPVAAWRVMKRGAEAILVHFHSAPYTSDASVRNVEEIALLLAAWQGPTMVITVPLIDFQKAVMIGAPHALRVLLYRRAMVRVAELVAHETRAGALVTGENLGQVASQTLTNIAVVDAAAAIPILRPLIGYDKQEIIDAADVIGTAEISRRPYDDCCSLFVPEHPATAARLAEVEHVERELGLPEWTQKLFDLRTTRVIAPSSPAPQP